MVGKAIIDVAAAHKHFSAACFNQAWDLIDKLDCTEADDCLMVALNQASIFHWMNRPDCTDMNLSVGYWQASRIQALLGNARRRCACPDLPGLRRRSWAVPSGLRL
jgi:hypothetical protein